jgi:hypothetical protein
MVQTKHQVWKLEREITPKLWSLRVMIPVHCTSQSIFLKIEMNPAILKKLYYENKYWLATPSKGDNLKLCEQEWWFLFPDLLNPTTCLYFKFDVNKPYRNDVMTRTRKIQKKR